MESDSHRIEFHLGLAVRRYLTHQGDPAIANLSSGLEYLLGSKWQERGLTPPLEFDGLAHNLVSIKSPDELHVVGLMYEIEKQTVDWFSADLRLAPGTSTLQSYALRYRVKGLQPPAALDRLGFERQIAHRSKWEWVHLFKG